MNTLHRYPFLKLLLPLLVGINLGHCLLMPMYWSIGNEVLSRYFTSAFCMIGVVLLFLNHFKKDYQDYLWGVALFLFILAAGLQLTKQEILSIGYQWSPSEQVYTCMVTEDPIAKGKTTKCLVRVEQTYNPINKKSTKINRQVLLYLPPQSHVFIGDHLVVFTQIQPDRNNNNPDEFDYASYLFHRKISGTAIAWTGTWYNQGQSKNQTIKQRALQTRQKLLGRLKSAQISRENQTVLAALILGYIDDLSRQTKDQYSISGVSHLLSLSGLHIGFIYFLLDFLLAPLSLIKGGGKAKQLIIIICLWTFAFITGLLPPVTRTVIMFSIVALARWMNNRPVTLNTLSATAFIMLIYNPLNLFSVSFQLSFLAVAGIIIINPLLQKIYKPQGRVIGYIWSVICVSLSAQIATLPFILYYFNSFPTYFLLTNILVLLLTSFIIYTAFFYLLTFLSPVIHNIVGFLLDKQLSLLNSITRGISHLPNASIAPIYPSLAQTILIGIIIITALFASNRIWKKSVSILLLGIMAICLLQAKADYTYHSRQEIVFYNNRNGSMIQFILPNRVNYLYSSNLPKTARQNFISSNKEFQQKNRLTPPVNLANGMQTGYICNKQGIIRFGNKTICVADNNFWSYKASHYPLSIDYLCLAHGYHGKIIYLTGLFNIKHIVLDNNLPDYKRLKIKQECNLLHIPYFDIKEKGALRIPA